MGGGRFRVSSLSSEKSSEGCGEMGCGGYLFILLLLAFARGSDSLEISRLPLSVFDQPVLDPKRKSIKQITI